MQSQQSHDLKFKKKKKILSVFFFDFLSMNFEKSITGSKKY